MKILQLFLKSAKNSNFLQQTWKESKRFVDSIFSCSLGKSKNVEKISDVSLFESTSPKTKQLFHAAIKKFDIDIGESIPFDFLEQEARSIKFKKAKSIEEATQYAKVCRLGFQPNNNLRVQICAKGCKNSAKNE